MSKTTTFVQINLKLSINLFYGMLIYIGVHWSKYAVKPIKD